MADKVTIELVIEDGKAVASIKKFGKKAKKSAEKSGESVGDSFSSEFVKSLKIIGPALAAAFTIAAVRNAIVGFAAFEQALVGVQKTTDLSKKELAKFSDTLQELSVRIPVSAKNLAGLAETAGRFGVRGSKNLELFTDTLAKLNVATDLVGEEGAEALVRILGVTGENIDQIGKLGAVITDLGNNFKTSESQIVSIASEIGRSTTQFGLSSTQIVALSAALSDLGAKAEGSGTGVSNAFIAIEKAIRNGGKVLDEFIELTGLTAEELEKTFKTNAAKVFELFIKGLSKVKNSGESVTATLERLGLSEKRTLKTLAPLAARFGVLATSIERANIQAVDQNALNDEAAKAFDTLQSDIQTTINSLSNLANNIVREFAPAIRGALDLVTSFSNAITRVIATPTAAQRIEELTTKFKGLEEELRIIDEGEFLDNIFNRFRGQVVFDIINTRQELERLKMLLGDTSIFTGDDANFLAELEKTMTSVANTTKKKTKEIQKIIFKDLGSTFVGFGKLTSDVFKRFGKQFFQTVNFTKQQSQKMADIFKNVLAAGIVSSVQTVVTALLAGENAFAALAGSLLSLIGNLAISIGQFTIAAGVAKLVLPLSPGGATIAAGIGLVALGTVLKSLGKNSFTGGVGGGGAVSPPELGDGAGIITIPPTRIGGGGVDTPILDETTIEDEELSIDDDFIERRSPGAQVTLIIQGDVLDRRETGLVLVEVLRETFQTNDIDLGGLTG